MAQPYERVSGGRWRRFTAAMPMRTALLGVAAVWALGCVWSFQEQWHFAAAKGFTLPWLLPLVIDGMAAAMAGVAYAASLDGRAAIPARVATGLAVAASAASNAAWAWERSAADIGAVTLAIGIPIAANLAFEVLLSELRRQMQRRRGQPPPVAVPYPRVIRFVLAPTSTFRDWRRLVLELTDPREACMPVPVAAPEPAGEPEPAAEPAAVTRPVSTVPVTAPTAAEPESPVAVSPETDPAPELVGADETGELVAPEPLPSVAPAREPLVRSERTGLRDQRSAPGARSPGHPVRRHDRRPGAPRRGPDLSRRGAHGGVGRGAARLLGPYRATPAPAGHRAGERDRIPPPVRGDRPLASRRPKPHPDVSALSGAAADTHSGCTTRFGPERGRRSASRVRRTGEG